MLEIGTHIGAYTVQIARALSLYGDESYKCSVDISDVNSTSAKPWLANNASHSPREEVNLAGVGENVEFFYSPSLNFFYKLQTTNRKFGLIFLDVDHSSKAVYKEIALALNKLNPNGVILVHDYFLEMKIFETMAILFMVVTWM